MYFENLFLKRTPKSDYYYITDENIFRRVLRALLCCVG